MFGNRTIIMHTLIEMGSAAFAAAVPYPDKSTRISRKGQRKYKENMSALVTPDSAAL